MGELQELQPRRHCLHHDTHPGGGLVSLPYHQSLSDRGQMKQEQLKDEVEAAAKRLADDVDLFGEVDGEGQAQ